MKSKTSLRKNYIFLFAVFIFLTMRVHAQNIVAPASHWGGLMYPNLEPTKEIGLQFANFTEFDKNKEVDGVCLTDDPRGRYNHIEETIGFNILAISQTRNLIRKDKFQSNFLYQSALLFGFTSDQPTEIFQNEVIHSLAGLCTVPRNKKRSDPFLLGYSGQLNYNFFALDRSSQSSIQFSPTPIFAGAGFSFGTVMQELFTQIGFHNYKFLNFRATERWFYFSFSAMSRLGVAYKGLVFDNIANQYMANQASIRLHLLAYSFPINLELAVTGHSGVFLNDAVSAENAVSVNDVVPLPEYFYSLRLEMGSFIFETFNDQLGGKDKGPTYGVRVSYRLLPGESLAKKALAGLFKLPIFRNLL